jgi:hypothetical protein
MSVPEHLWRFPTLAAIDALAQRFGFPNDPAMQDWEWQVADADRIDEFVAALETGGLSEDERFTLMEIVLQSFEELSAPLELDQRWKRVLEILDQNVSLHGHSICSWSCLDVEEPTNWWRVTPYMRAIFSRHSVELHRFPSKS